MFLDAYRVEENSFWICLRTDINSMLQRVDACEGEPWGTERELSKITENT